jgi:hypothetical protein
VRSKLWDSSGHIAPGSLPTNGQIMERLSQGEVNAKDYDTNSPIRMKQTIY